MTSNDPDQLVPEKTYPTVAETTTEPATHGSMRKDPNLTGSLQRTLASHGSFTKYLVDLAKSLFTHGDPYRATNTSDPYDSPTYGNITGKLASLMETQGNLTRRLLKVFGGPTEAVEDLPHLKDDLPYLPELRGHFTEVTSGITKEITANSQDPNQTINHSEPAYWSYEGITLENCHSPHLPPLTLFGRYHLFTPSFTILFSPPAQSVISYHIHHQTPSFITTYLYSPHHIYFTNSPHFTNGYNIKTIPHFPYFQLLIINHDFLSIRSRLQRLYFSNKGIKFRSTNQLSPTATF